MDCPVPSVALRGQVRAISEGAQEGLINLPHDYRNLLGCLTLGLDVNLRGQRPVLSLIPV